MSTIDDYQNAPEAKIVAELALRAGEPKEVTAGSLYAFHDIHGVPQVVDLLPAADLRRGRPLRRRGNVRLFDSESFIHLVNDLGTDPGRDQGKVRLYADPDELSVTAVLNDHDNDAGWGDHRVRLDIKRTVSWAMWIAGQGQHSQLQFAEHIENCRADIIDPSAADMLELAQTIEGTTSASFKAGGRLKDGSRQIAYVEDVNASAGKGGNLTIPDAMTIRVVPFEGGDPIDVEAKIRYRISRDGGLTIGYDLHRKDEIEREALQAVLDRIDTHLTVGAPVLLGRPPTA